MAARQAGAVLALSFLLLPAGLAAAAAGSASEAVGSYTSGRLRNAVALPPQGTGFVKIERLRGRVFGTGELAAALQDMGGRFAERFPEAARLQVGDLSARGGGTITLHKSHTNGLDVDLAMIAKDEREQDPDREGFDRGFCSGGALSADFDPEKNWAVVRAAAEQLLAERLFVSPEIKSLFCRLHAQEPDSQRALRILRPAAGHCDHFHLRLGCPADDKRCVPQDPVPDGNGCRELGALQAGLEYPD